jgi:hypothetical protein
MVDRVVLHVDLTHAKTCGEALGANERREARMQAGPGLSFDRQQLAVPPEVLRAALDEIARDQAANGVVIVGDLEGAQTAVADP